MDIQTEPPTDHQDTPLRLPRYLTASTEPSTVGLSVAADRPPPSGCHQAGVVRSPSCPARIPALRVKLLVSPPSQSLRAVESARQPLACLVSGTCKQFLASSTSQNYPGREVAARLTPEVLSSFSS